MASNASTSHLPPLPSYTLTLREPFIPGVSDSFLTLLLPIIAYWLFSMLFHVIDTYDLFPQYRLHTPAEVLKRNRVSRWDVVRDVVIQQFVQTVVGMGLSYLEEPDMVGKEAYDMAVWAQRLRIAQSYIPSILAVAGIDALALAQKASTSSSSLASVLAGGQYALIIKGGVATPAFAAWELAAAHAMYYYVVPAVQFVFAIIIVDTWQYFLHRAMHMNKWLYTTFHSRHHRLYVPYAYGALYNHPFEGFLLDTLGTGIAYLIAGLTPRQAMCFFTGSTIKTVDDHCGYMFPWDPLQHLTSNNAGYHDVHHQSWGIKTNFSQPFFTFWDRALGTVWTGGDVSARYERARLAAERSMANDAAPITGSHPIDSVLEDSTPYADDAKKATLIDADAQANLEPAVPAGKAAVQALASREQVLQDGAGGGAGVLADETAEEVDASHFLRRNTPRKRSSAQPASLKGLRDRVTGSGFHGRTGGVLGYEGSG